MKEILPILYRDDHLIAINKPAGLLVHRSEIDRHETRFALQILRDQLGQRVFPLHRLDKPTSGVLLFALSDAAARTSSVLFTSNSIKKTYVALVRGIAPSFAYIDHPLVEELDKMTDKKVSQLKPAQSASTTFHRLGYAEIPFSVDKYATTRYSLVKCLPHTGRKHQIRRHLKFISHPIIGDAKHGKGIHNRFFHDHYTCSGLFLCATNTAFTHPVTGEAITIAAPLNEDFSRIIKQLPWSEPLAENILLTLSPTQPCA
jgi:tRNA pseudouridine65 synthase